MKIEAKKCSLAKHKETNAISYCENCKIYMCNKCENTHSDLFENHSLIKTNKDFSELSATFCNEKGHCDKLRYYCKDHNKLCCAFCICKIKDNDNGQHSNCNVCKINEIKNEKKLELKENMKHLEDLSKNIIESINKIKNMYEEINEKKEKLKIKIQKVFTNIRNVINNREDELLLEIDNKFNNNYFKEEFIKEIEKLPNKTKKSLEKGKLLNNEWDEDNKLYSIINNCTIIENNIKDINKMNEIIKTFDNKINTNINFYPKEEKDINLFLENIKKFGDISVDNWYNSKIINNNGEYIKALKEWINPNENLNCKLLYRLSEHGEQFSKFHELCDNKGPLLVLYQVKDGNKVGIYTPLILDNNSDESGWKNDIDTFIFNLNQIKKYKKIKINKSLYYGTNYGMYTKQFGNGGTCQTMKKLVHYTDDINYYYEKGSEILPSKGKTNYHDLSEVEVFQIIK